MILVIDPHSESRTALLQTLSWADGRYHVQAFESASAAWAVIHARRRVNLVVCSIHLRDAEPLSFLTQLREYVPHAVLVIYADDATNLGNFPPGAVDGILSHPVCRYATLEYLKKIKEKRRGLSLVRNRRRTVRPLQRNDGACRGTRMGVFVRLDSENEPLNFKINLAAGTEVRSLLNQLGKKHIVWYRLHRKQDEVDAHESTLLQDGDVLVIRAT